MSADTDAVRAALQTLRSAGIPTSGVESAWQLIEEERGRKPDDDDKRWPVTAPTSIVERLNEIKLSKDIDYRPVLSSNLEVGMDYCLSPSQRDVVRTWYDMTPAMTVQVLEVNYFTDTTFGRLIREVVLKSCEHVDPRRKNVMVKFTINHWGKFMSQALENERRRANAKEFDAVVAKLDHLYDKLKASRGGIELDSRRSRELAHHIITRFWNEKPLDDEAKRELMKQELARFGLTDLVGLIKKPNPFQGLEPKVRKQPVLEELMNEYGV